VVTGGISSAFHTVFSYLDLQHVNQQLLERNSSLEAEVLRLQEQLGRLSLDTVAFSRVFPSGTSGDAGYTYEYITAGVANHTTNYVNNYITINKGFHDGIRPDMGVVSPSGVVGIVMTVRERYSVVISLLNTKFKVSCKVKGTSIFGSLAWKGGDATRAYLEGLPAHAVFQVGDTIVTSGSSAIFPPGLMVGVVESYNKQQDDNFYALKVRLATDFHSLSALCVIVNHAQEEQWKIEREAAGND
jgi:rod shape-determining protein MreC